MRIELGVVQPKEKASFGHRVGGYDGCMRVEEAAPEKTVPLRESLELNAVNFGFGYDTYSMCSILLS
jgi:hypothetical protein